MKKLIVRNPLLTLLITAFVFRIINLDWPYFSPGEAEMAIRIRNWIPWLGDIGIRLIFVVLGVLVVYLLYRLVLLFFKDDRLALMSGLVAAVSPPLIYLSRLPGLFSIDILGRPYFLETGLLANINIYRGQGLQMGWPNIVEKLLFNKSYFLLVGLLNWLSSLSPAVLFGQFDKAGIYGMTSMGAFPKILLIPFLTGTVYLIKEKQKILGLILFVVILFSFPSFFTYPRISYSHLLLTLPFMAVIIAYGLLMTKKRWTTVLLILAVAETLVNLLIIKPEIKLTNFSRPGWIISIVKDLSSYRGEKRLIISDDVVSGLDAYLRWYGRKSLTERTLVISQKNELFRCTKTESAYVIVGERDLAHVRKYIEDLKIEKTYSDFVGQPVAYKLEERICVR